MALDFRRALSLGQLLLRQAAAPSAPAAGLVALYAKTDGRLYTQTPAGAESPVGAGTELAYDEITTGTSEITTEADVGPSITFTLAATRKVLIRASFLFRSTTSGDVFRGLITDASNTQQVDTGMIQIFGTNYNFREEVSVRKSLAAATYTYKMRAVGVTSAGTTIVSASAANPTYIQAIDLGP
jgi:hypothetical protein